MDAGPEPGPRTTTLPNGVRVVSDAMPHARSETTGVWVAVGGRDEPPELAGASHFLEHLFFKGTDAPGALARSARTVAEAVEAQGVGEQTAGGQERRRLLPVGLRHRAVGRQRLPRGDR